MTARVAASKRAARRRLRRCSRTCASTPKRRRTIPLSRASSRESGDLYVNDAFGTAHRAHASTAGVAADLPAYAGFLMEAELAALARLTEHPAHPFVCAIGGAKVVDKVGVFENLLAKVDAFVIGGGMANTFLAAQGINVGRSLRDPDLMPGTADHRDGARRTGVDAAPADRRGRRGRVRRRRHGAHRGARRTSATG